jgi:hypothetical protein
LFVPLKISGQILRLSFLFNRWNYHTKLQDTFSLVWLYSYTFLMMGSLCIIKCQLIILCFGIRNKTLVLCWYLVQLKNSGTKYTQHLLSRMSYTVVVKEIKRPKIKPYKNKTKTNRILVSVVNFGSFFIQTFVMIDFFLHQDLTLLIC